LIGFSAYTAYNCALFFNPVIRAQYRAEYGSEPKVEANDVFFAIHAVVLTVVTVVQCFVYERGAQRLSVTASVLIVCAALAALVYAGLLGANVVHKTSWLHFLIFVSYIKLGVTLIKYIPQAYMNFVRRTTDGFNMQNVLLDFTGGFLSVAQLLMDCAVTKDWSGIAGDPVKFGLGLTSMVFDVLFMVQHFVLFPANNARYARARAAMALLSADDADELRTILNSDGITRDPSVLSVHSPRVRAVLHDIHNNSPSPSTGDSASLLPSQ
jgi:cystinosin